MKSAEFIEWMTVMGKKRGKDRLSERDAETILGLSRMTVRRYLAGGEAPKYIGLACAALAAGKTEWPGRSARAKAAPK